MFEEFQPIPQLSLSTKKLFGQPMFSLLSEAKKLEAKGKKIIHFELGDPNFESPKDAIKSACSELQSGNTHYADSQGLLELREAIASYTNKSYNFKPNLKQILVGPANSLIDFTLRCVANPKDDVILSDPCFPTYSSVISYQDLSPIFIPLLSENKFRMDPNEIEKKITPNTKIIIINSPNNPTGGYLNKDDINHIYKIAEDNNLFILSDEVYSKLIFNGTCYSPSTIDLCRTRTIILNSMSKSFSMTGWRVGYCVGPEKLIEKMTLLLQTILSCLPPFTQVASAKVLNMGEDFIQKVKIEYKERATLLVEGLNKLNGINCLMPAGALYVFPKLDTSFMNTFDYSKKILEEEGVCLLPGEYFGKSGNGHLRLSFSSTSKNDIKLALRKMHTFHSKYF